MPARFVGKLIHLFLVMILPFLLEFCKKDSSPPALYFTDLSAGGVDLMPVNEAMNVPPDARIVAAFNLNVLPSNATTSNIQLQRLYDSVYINITISVEGNEINIIPSSNLGNGQQYKLMFTNLLSSEGTYIYYVEKTFTTIGRFAPAGQVAYWNFEGNTYDQVGSYNGNFDKDLNYVKSFNNSLGLCAAFNGTSTIIEVPGGDKLVNTQDFSLSFWVKPVSYYHIDSSGNPKGQFVLGVGDFKGFEFDIASDYSSCKLSASYSLPDNTTIEEDLSFAGDGKTGANGGPSGWTYCVDLRFSGGVASLLKDRWAFVTCTYNSQTKLGTMYINGLRMKEQDFNKWPVGDPARNITGMKYAGTLPLQENILALGFFHSRNSTDYSSTSWGNYYSIWANHFRGNLDELRIFNTCLTAREINQMYINTRP